MITTVEPLHPIDVSRRSASAGPIALYWALALGFLLVYGIIEWQFRALGTLTVNDVLFDADPGTRVRAIAHGWERLLLVHPLFPYVFTVPIRLVTRGWTLVAGHGAAGEQAIRETLAMVVAPVFGAAAVAMMVKVLLATGVGRVGSVICAIGFGLSFSNLIFASIPDHFIVSNLLALVGLWLCTMAGSERAGRLPGLVWWPLGVAATGVTISNLAIPACCYFATQYRSARDIWGSARATAKYASVVALVTAVLALAGAAASGEMHRLLPQELGGGGSESMLLRYIASNPLARAARAPKAVADSLVAGELTLAPPGSSDKTEVPPVPHLSLETGAKWLGAPLVVLALLVAAIAGHRQADKGFSAPVAAALGILGANVAFHAMFGKEYFLYSQHWMASMWLVLAGLWRLRYWKEPFCSTVAFGAVVLMGYLNYGTLLRAFELLRAV